jgi:adenylate cyclase
VAADTPANCIKSRAGARLLKRMIFDAWRTLAAAAGKTGNLNVAAGALSEANRLHPSLSVEWVEKHHPIVQREGPFDLQIEWLGAAGLK